MFLVRLGLRENLKTFADGEEVRSYRRCRVRVQTNGTLVSAGLRQLSSWQSVKLFELDRCRVGAGADRGYAPSKVAASSDPTIELQESGSNAEADTERLAGADDVAVGRHRAEFAHRLGNRNVDDVRRM